MFPARLLAPPASFVRIQIGVAAPTSGPMRHFRFLVMDRRQRTPALFHVETTDEARARELAAGILRRSADHEQVTIWEDGRLLATIAPQVGNPTER